MTTTKEAIEQNEITTPADFYDSWTDAYEFSRMGEELILLQEQLLSLRDLLENEATLKMFVPTLCPSLELSKKMVGDKMTETENSIKKLLEKRERHIERHVKEKEETKARNKRINDAYTEIRAALLFYLPDPIRDRVQFFSVSRDGFFVPFGDDEAITKRAAMVDITLNQYAYSAYQKGEIKTAVVKIFDYCNSRPVRYNLTKDKDGHWAGNFKKITARFVNNVKTADSAFAAETQRKNDRSAFYNDLKTLARSDRKIKVKEVLGQYYQEPGHKYIIDSGEKLKTEVKPHKDAGNLSATITLNIDKISYEGLSLLLNKLELYDRFTYLNDQ